MESNPNQQAVGIGVLVEKVSKSQRSCKALFTMDTEELIRKCQAINIREEDKAKITLEVNLEKKKELMMAGCLVGKVMLTKGVNK